MPRSDMPSRWRILLALLCMLLVISTGTIQAVHAHPLGDISHADCSLCVSAHAVVQVSTPPVALFAASIYTLVETAVEPTRQRTLFTFALFTRPPPVDRVLA